MIDLRVTDYVDYMKCFLLSSYRAHNFQTKEAEHLLQNTLFI